MNIRAGLGEYILQTHNTIFEDSRGGGVEPPNPPPSGYASVFQPICSPPDASRNCWRPIVCYCSSQAQEQSTGGHHKLLHH